MPRFLQRHGEWIRFAMTVAAVAALHFFDDRYVSISTYQSDRKEWIETAKQLSSSVTSLQTAIALLQRQDETFRDHETRIRSLEQRKLGSLAPVFPAFSFARTAQ